MGFLTSWASYNLAYDLTYHLAYHLAYDLAQHVPGYMTCLPGYMTMSAGLQCSTVPASLTYLTVPAGL